MYAGRIVETGTLREVVKQPAHPYTRGLSHRPSSARSRGRRLEAIPGAPPRLDRLPQGCSFAPRCGLADAACRQGEIPAVLLAARRSARCVKLVAKAAE